MPLRHEIPLCLRTAYLAMHRQTSARLQELGITADQFVCLLVLNEHASMIQRELVERTNSDQNTIRAMLVLLEKRKLVQRKPHAEDKRALMVGLTPKGRKICAQAFELLSPVHGLMSASLSKGETATLRALLGKLTGALTPSSDDE
jgi:DNA-binding MarR family transcriptional regulator